MPIFKWDDSYSVSVKQLDAQHQHLVSLLNKLSKSIREGQAQQSLSAILTEISADTVSHFADEEALMKKTQFPELQQHVREHQKLTAQLENFIAKHREDAVAIDINLALFIRDWLVQHIAESDKRYSAHLNNSGIE